MSTVTDNQAASRFELTVEGHTAIAAYTLARLTEARQPATAPQSSPFGGHTSYGTLTR